MSFVEPTAAVVTALSLDAASTPFVQRARRCLLELQHDDGGWGIAAPDEESGWMTAWAVWSLAASDRRAAERGAAWLLGVSGLHVTDPEQVAGVYKVLRIDATLTGWPWLAGDAAWIFPTALGILALASLGQAGHPRVQEAARYLLDRAIPTGGWNIGNPFMVAGEMNPTVENTTLALMALDALRVESEAARRARVWLAQDGFTPTAFEWAWRGWYWAARPNGASAARENLRQLQRADGSWDGNPFTTAIGLLAGGESA